MRGGIRYLAATALLGLLPLIQAQAAASNLTSLSASLSSSEVSATSVTLTLTLVTSGTISSGSDIMFTLAGSPSSFNVSSVTGSSITSNTMTGSGSISSFGDSTFLKFTPSVDAAAGTHTITVANITNPSSASTGTVTLSTTGFGGFSGGATSTATVTVGSGDGDTGGDEGGFDEGGFEGGGSVTGDNSVTVTVTDGDGTALANETVSAYCGMSYQTGTTDSAGQATLSSLANGNCGVWLTSDDYFAEEQRFTFAAADDAQTEEISLSVLALDTNVEVTVTDLDGAAAESIYVYMTNAAGQEFYGGTDSNGVAEFGVVYGTYTLNGYVGSQESSYYLPESTYTISETGIAADGNTNEIAVQLEEYSSFITTSAVDSAGNSISSIRNLVYNADMMRFSQGADTIGVIPGTYTVKFESDGYANTAVRNVEVAAGETVSVEATMDDANNTLNLTMVDADGATVAEDGYVFCKDPQAQFDPAEMYFGFMQDGVVDFTFPNGDFQCNANVTGYVSDDPTFTMADAETEAGEILLTVYDATLTVNLVDQDGNDISGSRYGVFGESADGYTLSGYSMGGAVSIGALGGHTYTLRVYMMEGGYISDYNNPTEVTLASGDSETVTLTVFETPGSIAGTVTNPAGEAVSGASVKSTCTTKTGKTFEFTTTTDNAGEYTLAAVNGTCMVNSAVADGLDLPSGDTSVKISEGASVDQNLELQASTATLKVSPASATTSGIAALDVESGSCYAYNTAGAYVTAEVDTDTGKANLPVLAGDWSYGCRVVVDDKVKVSAADGVVTMKKGDTESVQASVGAADDNFSDQVVQFSATSDTVFTLPDGTEVYVPANALDNSGNVTISASMATGVPSEDDVAAGPAIDFTARDSNNRKITGGFNADITIKFNYTKDMLAKYGLTEADLVGGYSYSDGALAVTDQGYTIDTENNSVTVTTDHFSTFTVAGVKAAAPGKAKNLKVKNITDSTAKLTWKAPSTGEVTKYKVQMRKHGVKKTSKWTTYKKVTKTNKAIKELLASTRYQFRVKACNGTDCSAYTDWKAFKTTSE